MSLTGLSSTKVSSGVGVGVGVGVEGSWIVWRWEVFGYVLKPCWSREKLKQVKDQCNQSGRHLKKALFHSIDLVCNCSVLSSNQLLCGLLST